jgi:hypothetical protein
MPLCVVAWTVLVGVLTLIPQLVARFCGVSCGPGADAERMVEMFALIVLQSAASSSCMVEICFKANLTPLEPEAASKGLESKHRRLGSKAPTRSPVSNTSLARACFLMPRHRIIACIVSGLLTCKDRMRHGFVFLNGWLARWA